jgi:sugar O-acyltransferase (sialic acid O-acetyltransferase NeuD family)
MADPLFAVYGASGCGRGVMPLARLQLQKIGIAADRLVFIDDYAEEPEVNGQSVLRLDDFLDREASARYVVIAIANSRSRQDLAEKCMQLGLKAWGVRAVNCVTMDDVSIGEGAILSPFVTITSNVSIGTHFHANLYSYVEHDCRIGNFVTFAPGVQCNGNVIIEDHAYIGAGALIRQGTPNAPLTIGRGAIVGMGAVVTKNVAPSSTVVGNPARLLRR